MIVYYTGTGNSRYVAQRFAAALGDDLITANEYIKNDTPADLHADRPWVFVSPTYGWQIPHIFAAFLRRGRFTGSRKAYFVMTCGSEIGNAGSRIAALCADIGLDYQGVLQVVMPENYVAMFYVPGAEESAQIIAAAQPMQDSRRTLSWQVSSPLWMGALPACSAASRSRRRRSACSTGLRPGR